MRLTDLHPQLFRYEFLEETWDIIDGDPETWRARGCPTRPFTGLREHRPFVDTIAAAQGVFFTCPVCPDGHGIAVSFHDRGLTDAQGSHNRAGQPSRWTVSGTGYGDLTLSPSIDVGCWHGYVTNGEAL